MTEIRVSGNVKTALKRALARVVGPAYLSTQGRARTIVWSWTAEAGRYETLPFGLGEDLRPVAVADASALKKGKKADEAVVKLGDPCAVPDLPWLAGVQEIRVDGRQLAELARACGSFVGRDPARPQFGNVALARFGRVLELRAGDGHGECKGVIEILEEVEAPLGGFSGCALSGDALKLLEDLDGPTRVRVCPDGAAWTCGNVTTWVRAAAVGPDAPAKVETREVARVDAELLRVGLEGLHGDVALRVGEGRLRLTCPTRVVEIGTLRTKDEETR